MWLATYASIQLHVVEKKEACSLHCKAAGQAALSLSSIASVHAAHCSTVTRASRDAHAEHVVTFDLGRQALAEGNRER